jgi:hypothetical protein
MQRKFKAFQIKQEIHQQHLEFYNRISLNVYYEDTMDLMKDFLDTH